MKVLVAWALGYNAPVVIVSVLGAAAAISRTAATTVPTVGAGGLPLGILMPPMLAMLVALGCSSRLPTPRRPTRRLLLARAIWSSLLLSLVALAAGLVGAFYQVDHLVEATVLLAATSIGVSAVLGRGAIVVGAATACALLVHAGSFRGSGLESAALGRATTWLFELVGIAAVAAYVRFGSRADLPHMG